jgi:shikimate dehydrogenase
MNRKYRLGIIGHPLGHTLSPVMHTAAAARLGLDLAYDPFDVKPANLAGFMAGLRDGPLDGLNVTVPHKTAVMEYLDTVSPEAERIGAVNTIVIRGGRLAGENTDAYGFMASLTQNARVNPAGKRALVIGAGGAARAVVWALALAGARTAIANRTEDRARGIAADFAIAGAGVAVIPFDPDKLAEAARAAEIIVNATSVGMKSAGPGALAEVERHFHPGQLVVDIVYRPPLTPFLAAAQRAGCATLDGLWMLIHQGAKSFTLWTSRPFPVELAREKLLEALGEERAG